MKEQVAPTGLDPSAAARPDARRRRILWLCSDGHRALVCFGLSLLVPVLARAIVTIVDPPVDQGTPTQVILILLGWNTFAVSYVALTALAFARVDSDEFRLRMAIRGRPHRRGWRFLNASGDGPTYAIESAIVAFAVVLVLPHIDAIRLDDALLIPVTLTILLSSWALGLMSYSLHYAQHDLAEPALEFPGTRTNAFADYLYFALAVATTFGATDVNIITPRMRRVVNLHTFLTFLYNSVIVALLASLLLS